MCQVILARLVLENCMISVFVSTYSSLYWEFIKDNTGGFLLNEDFEKQMAQSIRGDKLSRSPTFKELSVPIPEEGDKSPNRTNTLGSSVRNLPSRRKEVKRPTLNRPIVSQAQTKLNGAIMVSRAANKFKLILKRNKDSNSPKSQKSIMGFSFLNRGAIRDLSNESFGENQGSQANSMTIRDFGNVTYQDLEEKVQEPNRELNKPYRVKRSAHNSDHQLMPINEIKSNFGSRRSIPLAENKMEESDGEADIAKGKYQLPRIHLPGMDTHKRAQNFEFGEGSKHYERQISIEDGMNLSPQSSESRKGQRIDDSLHAEKVHISPETSLVEVIL